MRVKFFKSGYYWGSHWIKELVISYEEKNKTRYKTAGRYTYFAYVIDKLFLDGKFLNGASKRLTKDIKGRDLVVLKALIDRGSYKIGLLRKFLEGEISKKEFYARLTLERLLKKRDKE